MVSQSSFSIPWSWLSSSPSTMKGTVEHQWQSVEWEGQRGWVLLAHGIHKRRCTRKVNQRIIIEIIGCFMHLKHGQKPKLMRELGVWEDNGDSHRVVDRCLIQFWHGRQSTRTQCQSSLIAPTPRFSHMFGKGFSSAATGLKGAYATAVEEETELLDVDRAFTSADSIRLWVGSDERFFLSLL